MLIARNYSGKNDNKRQGWSYDSAGNTFSTFDGSYTYDAAERPVSFSSFQTWKVYPNWPSNPPDGPALETHDTFDGSGQLAKHVNITREDDSYDSEYGFMYWLSENTTTTYYVHSMVLGGKTIAEVQSNGSIGDRFVYAGGARIATYHWMAGYAEIESTNPVTGAAITADVNGNNATRQEPDPLGRELAQAPPNTPVNQLGSPNLKDRAMPIEYTGGPSDYYLQGNADWAAERAEYTWQYQNGYFDKGGYFDLKNQFINAVINQHFGEAAQLLARNPNFVLEINGQMTAGQRAADALTTALAKLPGDPLGMNQNTASVAVVGGPALGGNPQDSGKRWIGGDRLSDCYKKLLKSSFAFDLANVSIYHYIPLGPRIWADPDGYTFGYATYFKNFNPSTEKGFKDLLHELTHVQQFKELGYLGFPKEYLKEYRQNRKKGMSDQDAYFNMRLEEEARQHADETYKRIIADNHGKNPCAQ